MRRIFFCLCWGLAGSVCAQSTNAPLNADYYHWIDRYEVKSGSLVKELFTTVKPYKRSMIVAAIDSLQANENIFQSEQQIKPKRKTMKILINLIHLYCTTGKRDLSPHLTPHLKPDCVFFHSDSVFFICTPHKKTRALIKSAKKILFCIYFCLKNRFLHMNY